MDKVELLAPAGDMDCLKYAIEAGADAVYLGGKTFGARSFAKNFTNEEIIEAIKIAHEYGVKIYVTINTLIYDNEVSDFMNYVKFLHENNVDAVIVQDFGMIDLLHQTYPNLEVHVSTQAHIHNLDGVKLMEKLGATRVVLARETSLETIKDICKNTNIELEIFAQGALCISYSGQCLMSSLLGGRSGNRGCCAGTCRLPYDLYNNELKKLNKNKYLLSTKDLNILPYINQLLDLNITSLKIEGRMKSKEYVYTVTKLYRQAIDSYYKNHEVFINPMLIDNLKKIFNRGFTKGFIFHEDNNNFTNEARPNHNGILIGKVISSSSKYIEIKLNDELYFDDGIRIEGDSDIGFKINEMYIDNKLVKKAKKNDIIKIKTKGKIKLNSPVYLTLPNHIAKTIASDIQANPRKIPLNVKVIAKINQPLTMIISDIYNSITLKGNILEKAINYPTSKDTILEKINKTNNTIYKFTNIDIDTDNLTFIPITDLTSLRRQALEQLSSLRQYKIKVITGKYKREVPNFPCQQLKTVLIEDKSLLTETKDKYDIIYCEEPGIKNTIYKTPRVIDNYHNLSSPLLVGEIGALNILKNVDTDYSLNVTNSYTLALLHSLGANKVTLSCELLPDQVKNLLNTYETNFQKHPNTEIIINSYIELMISKFSLNNKYHEDILYLKDRKDKYFLVKTKNGLMTIYNYQKNNSYPYYQLGINSIRENKVRYTKNEFK